MPPFAHAVVQIKDISIDDEAAVASMMDGSPLLAIGIEPEPFDLQNEEVVLVDEAGIGHPAFDIGDALPDQGRPDVAGRYLRQVETLEFIEGIPGAVTNIDDRFCQIDGRYGDDALIGFPQRFIGVVPRADDAADQRRSMLDHHVETHCHNVGLSTQAGRHEHNWPRLEQPMGMRGW